MRWVRIFVAEPFCGEALLTVSPDSSSDCRCCREFLLWCVFCPAVSVMSSWRGALPTGNSATHTHHLCPPGLNPAQTSVLVSGLCVCVCARSGLGGMQCLCWRARRGSVWPWWLHTISMQPFITACAHTNTQHRSEHTLCCHSQDAPNWDKMKSVKT